MLMRLKAYFSIFNLRYFWAFLSVIILYAFIGTFNTPEYLFSVLCAFLSAGIVLAIVRYRWTSLISVFVLGHIVQYPLAALIVLSLSSPNLSIEQALWPTTPAAMWAMVVGMAGLAMGVILSRLYKTKLIKINVKKPDENWITPVYFNVALTMLIVPLVFFYISLGFYYHQNVAVYDGAASITYGFLGYLQYISLSGVVLQLRRYTVTNKKQDLIYLMMLLLVTFVAVAPSGSRRNALFALVVVGICYLEWGNNERRKIFLFFGGSCIFMLMLPIMEMYRGVGVAGATSFMERLSILSDYLLNFKSIDSDNKSIEIFLLMLGRRLADYISVGFLIDAVPAQFPYSGFGDVGQWIYYTLPTLVRPDIDLSYAYDAIIMDQYGFRPIALTGGSSPMMIIGDLYNRAGWYGIFGGMAVLGFILHRLDRWLGSGSFRSIVVWVLLIDSVVNLHSYTLLKFFTMMTRHLLIYIVIAYLLERFLRAFNNHASTDIR